MKKKILLFALATLASSVFTASAQDVKFGLEAGYDHDFWKASVGGFKESFGLNGVHFGPMLFVDFDKGLGIRTGLQYRYCGGSPDNSFLGDSEKAKLRSHNIDIPIQLSYTYMINRNFGIYGFAGPKIELGISAVEVEKEGKNKTTYNLYTGKTKYKINGQKVDSEDVNTEGELKRFDLKMGIGVGACYQNMYFQFGFDFGMLNRYKTQKSAMGWDTAFNTKLHNHTLQVSVGYKF